MVLNINHQIIIRLIITISLILNASSQSPLRVGYYDNSCPNAERIVRAVVRQAVVSDWNAAPRLLRLHYQDCFVQGCDGSVLIDNGLETDEKRAFGHQGVGGFDIIDNAKAQLEATCPGIVSCSDIVAIAARDAVVEAKGPFYEVETGRRDGLISNRTLAEDHLPEVTHSIMTLKAKFSEKGLTDKDLVLLSAGAHTVGTASCFFLDERLYKSPPGNGSDPSINPAFLPELKSTCPKKMDVSIRLAIDRGSGQMFDNHIMDNINSGFTVLQSDAALFQDEATRLLVDSYSGDRNESSFEADFPVSMVRMGRIGVLTGKQGTIRHVCSKFN